MVPRKSSIERNNPTETLALAGIGLLLAVGLWVGVGAATDGQETPNLTVYDGSNVALTDAADIEDAIENGTIERTNGMVVGGTLVVAIESDRLVADMAARNGTTSERFFEVLDGGADFRLERTGLGSAGKPKVVRLGPRNTTVHLAGNTTYALLDTDAFQYRLGSAEGSVTANLEDDDSYVVAFGYNREGYPPEGPEVVLSTMPAKFPDRSSRLLTPDEVNLSVEVIVDPDRSLFVRATLGSNRTITAPVGPVEWNNYARVPLDFSDVDSGTSYELELVHDGTVVDRRNGTIVEPQATIRNPRVDHVLNQTVVKATVALSHGGQVAVLNEEGTQLGHHEVYPTYLAPINSTTVTIELRNGKADELRLRALRDSRSGTVVYPNPNATATIDFSDREIRNPAGKQPTGTATSRPTSTVNTPNGNTTPTETATRPTATTAGTMTATPGESGPGFDAVPVLVAVIVFFLVRYQM